MAHILAGIPLFSNFRLIAFASTLSRLFKVVVRGWAASLVSSRCVCASERCVWCADFCTRVFLRLFFFAAAVAAAAAALKFFVPRLVKVVVVVNS